MTREENSEPVRSAAGVLAVACVAGLASMAVELAAIRLLAPWFGSTTVVWTNVLGVVLLGLSTGYLLGGRFSTGDRPSRTLAIVLALSAVWTAWLPGISAIVARALLPENLSLDQAGNLLTLASLACATVLFLPTSIALGCVPPLATELVQRAWAARATQGDPNSDRASAVHAGRAGGMVLSVSTLGSLVGTFGATYVAIPHLGLSTTFLALGALLALAALVLCISRWRAHGGQAMVALVCVVGASGVLVALACLWSRTARPALRQGLGVLEASESKLQSVRVVEAPAEALRFLEVNEAFDSYQSVHARTPGLLPEGYYYNLFALPAWWSEGSGEWRVGVVGLGAGTVWRVLAGALPASRTLAGAGAEIDPEVVRLGARWMDLDPAAADLRVLAGVDGRVALHMGLGPFDQLVVDAYANQTEIPAHLATLEFFAAAHASLATGGWLSVNVGAFGPDDPVLLALGSTIAAVFEQDVLAVRVPFARNWVLFARRDRALPVPGDRAWLAEGSCVARLAAQLALPDQTRTIARRDAALLTDDLCPIEHLQRRSVELAALRLRAQP